MGTTSPLGIPYPDPGDPLSDIQADMQALAEFVDDVITALSAVAAVGWTAATLGTGWTGTVEYARSAGMVTVELDGVTKASWSAGDVIATLPAGFRPSRTVHEMGELSGSTRPIQVTSAGEVQASAAGSGGIYGSITFPV